MSETYNSTTLKQNVIAIRTPVFDDSGSLVGIWRGSLKLQFLQESIKEIAKRCIDIFRLIAESKSIRLVDKTQDITIKCDPDRILQVLSNVVSNAMKFVPA